MPSKTTKGAIGGANNKTHNRASSTTSSNGKLNLSVAFARNKSAEFKRNTSDVHLSRNTSPYPRQPQNKAPLSPPPKRITPLQVEIGGDDDEWVSSESGAATPAEYDEEDTPPSPDETVDENTDIMPSTTPRGDPPPAPPPANQRRPRPQSLVDLPRVDTVTQFTTQPEGSQSPDSLYHNPPTPTHRPNNRLSLTRPPSMRSGHTGRPHPLIRARSYAPATPTLAAPPALTSDSAQVHTASATTSPTSSPHKSHGQSYIHTPIASSPTSEHQFSPFHPRLRRQSSRSSVTSVATLPLPTSSSAATASTTRVNGERHRTLSHASTSAALSSLNAATHPHAPSRPPSPLLTIAFPPVNPRGEHAHVMIPPPLVPPHASATAHQNPILEALQRVAEAKQRAGR